jgi:hypothetical protein
MMNNNKKLILTLVGVMMVVQTAVPNISLAAGETFNNTAEQAKPVLLVREHESTLVAKGCMRIELTDTQTMKGAKAAGWLPMVPSDATGEALVACPPEVAATVSPLGEGEVKGVFVTLAVIAGAAWAIDKTYTWATGEEEGPVEKAVDAVGSAVGTGIAATLALIFELFAKAGNYISTMMAEYIPRLLIQDKYTSSEIVKTYWPVVLGIANMGFLLALVVIALFTTLRLDMGGGVRRMLPRLLIAALLVNFSLVIAGVIIDFSRIIMSLMTVMFGLPNLDALPTEIVADSAMNKNFVTWMEDSFEKLEAGSVWAGALTMLFNAIAMWTMAIAMLIILITLLIRYIAILTLLIFSPFAYVLFAFPNTAGLAARWWKTFLKYVIVGPIILFFMLVAIKSVGDHNELRELFDTTSKENGVWGSALFHVLNVIMFSTFFILAAMAGKFAGVVGSSAMVSMATRAGKRVRAAAYRGTVRTGRAAGKAIYVGTGTRQLSRRVKYGARDFYRPVAKATRKGIEKLPLVGRFLTGPERDEKGELLKGERGFADTVGRRAAAKMGTYPKGVTEDRWERQMKKAGTSTAAIRDPSGAYANISNRRAGTAMSNKQARAIMNVAINGDIAADASIQDHEKMNNATVIQDFERMKSMTSNAYAFNNIDEKDRAELLILNDQEIINGLNKKRRKAGVAELDDKTRSRLERIIRDTKTRTLPSQEKVIGPDWV